MELSDPSELQEGSVFTAGKMFSLPLDSLPKPPNRKRKSVTHESLLKNKKKISSDKSKTSKPSTPTTKSSKTLEAVSTSNGKDSPGFWTEYTTELSKKFVLHTETDYVDLESSSWNGSLKRLASSSWYSVRVVKLASQMPKNLEKTSLPSQQSLWQDLMDCVQRKTVDEENKKQKKKERQKPTTIKPESEIKPIPKKKEDKIPAGKAIKIRLYLTKDQTETLKKWFGTARWTYNQCLRAVKEGTKKSKKDLRAKCLNAENFQENNKWVLDTPFDVRDEAMNDLLKAYQTNFAKGKEHKFEIRYRSKKQDQECITIHSKHWKKAGVFYPTAFGKEPIRGAELLPDKLGYDSKLIRTRLNEFYICIPRPLEVRSENQGPKTDNVISLDPGVRTFCTGYDLEGTVSEWGRNDISRIYRLCHAHDRLQSKWTSKDIRHDKRYKLKKAGARIRKKIQNLIKDLHCKFTKYLCENYKIVLLPEFETQRMVKRAQRRIESKTARAMLTWSHYKFKQRLLHKAREYPWCKVVICDEHYTSKTCGQCGKINWKLGSNKRFKCPSCGIVMDRDINASRNILLRFLTINKEPSL